MSDELQQWMRKADYKMKRELAGVVKEQADRLADAIRAVAPVKTGRLRDSIRVYRTRKELRFVVTAKATREYVRNVRYEREVAVGSGDTQGIARGSTAGVTYDYAVAVEFGNERAPAQPFFYNTARALEADIRAELEKAVGELISR
jgi:HK97 gp10 family phage protein